LIQRQHNVSEPIPAFYIRTLSGLESAVNAALAKEKASSRKMNATNAKALTAMKQKMKKAVKEHESLIKQYQKVRYQCLIATHCPCTRDRIPQPLSGNMLPQRLLQSQPFTGRPRGQREK